MPKIQWITQIHGNPSNICWVCTKAMYQLTNMANPRTTWKAWIEKLLREGRAFLISSPCTLIHWLAAVNIHQRQMNLDDTNVDLPSAVGQRHLCWFAAHWPAMYWSETAVRCLLFHSLETRTVILGKVTRQWPLVFIILWWSCQANIKVLGTGQQ